MQNLKCGKVQSFPAFYNAESGYVRNASTTYVYADTVDEYLETGAVVSVTDEDFR